MVNVLVTILLLPQITLAEKSVDSMNVSVDITQEKKEVNNVFKKIKSSNPNQLLSKDIKIFDNNVASEFAPKNSTVTEVLYTDFGIPSISIDYTLGDSRVIVTYFEDGKVEKSILNRTSGYITENFNNEKKNTFNRNDVITISRSKEQLDTINTLIKERNFEEIEKIKDTTVNKVGGKTIISFDDSNAGILANKKVYPVPYDPEWKKYKAKFKYGMYHEYSKALDDRGYDPHVAVKVYETMDYFNYVDESYKNFSAGRTVTAISLFWDVAKSGTFSWLSYAAVFVDTYERIKSSISAVDEAAWNFEGGKEGTVYDPTRSKTNVQTWETWGTGRVVLGWNYNSSTGYNNPNWYHSKRSTALQMSDYTVFNNAFETYNNNINMYGVWKWGEGRLGY
ncbi:hypothetical protein SAMN05216225_101737 [Ornithinibacillus halophilus]|uniref:Uncharacterized protein n=2 Tax=Ornithinibacillus halophilus TaxID=930117 RepID=A0A1M5HFL4_9BACI|nr:hypothetical protein SAMN05216225_101737 [Ornithinibacillus halophilus]